jgi:hypothetical protein
MPPLAPVLSAAVATAVTRIVRVDDPPLVRAPPAAGSWPDQRLHRLVRLPPWDAAVALHEVLRAATGRVDEPPRERGARARLRTRPGRLLIERTPAAEATLRFAGTLRMPAPGRAVPIELVLEPWSAHRSDLCLQPQRGRLGPRLPRRYYDVAHRVMDELWHLIERAATA